MDRTADKLAGLTPPACCSAQSFVTLRCLVYRFWWLSLVQCSLPPCSRSSCRTFWCPWLTWCQWKSSYLRACRSLDKRKKNVLQRNPSFGPTRAAALLCWKRNRPWIIFVIVLEILQNFTFCSFLQTYIISFLSRETTSKPPRVVQTPNIFKFWLQILYQTTTSIFLHILIKIYASHHNNV